MVPWILWVIWVEKHKKTLQHLQVGVPYMVPLNTCQFTNVLGKKGRHPDLKVLADSYIYFHPKLIGLRGAKVPQSSQTESLGFPLNTPSPWTPPLKNPIKSGIPFFCWKVAFFCFSLGPNHRLCKGALHKPCWNDS